MRHQRILRDLTIGWGKFLEFPVGQFGNGKSPELVTSIANGVSQMMFMVCLFVFGRSIVKFADDNILHNTESKVIFQNIKFYWVFFNKNKINLERRKLKFLSADALIILLRFPFELLRMRMRKQ